MATVSFSIQAIDKTRAVFASVRSNLRGMSKETDAAGKRMMGAIIQGGSFALLAREVRTVADNIKDIPGIPQDTRQSVEEMNQTLTTARDTVRGLMAEMMAGFATGAKSLGSTLGAITWTDFLNPMSTAAALGTAQATVVSALEDETQKYIKALQAQTDAEKAQAAATKAAKDALDRKNAVVKAGREGADAALKQMADQRKMSADYQRSLRDEGEAIRKSLLTPTEEYAESLDRISFLRDSSAISADTYARKVKALQDTALDFELESFFGDMDKESAARINRLNAEAKETTKTAKELGWAFASTFEDAVINGGKLSDVLRGLAADVAKIFLRNTITDPLARGLSGMFSGFSFSGAKPDGKAAGGGAMAAGDTFLVGENGPELFTTSAAGRVIPNHELGGSGGVGDSYSFVYHIAPGVTRGELLPLLKASQDATIGKIRDLNARRPARGAYA